MTYAEKLQNPKWQEKRLRIMDRDKFQCQTCGSQSKNLNVHHRFYIKGREPWEYGDETLETLCRDCHEIVSKAQEYLKEFFGQTESIDLVHFVNKLRNCEENMNYPKSTLFWFLEDSLTRPGNEEWEPPKDAVFPPGEDPFE